MRHILSIAAILVSATGLVAAEGVSDRPACTASIRGQFWPEAANTNPEVAHQAARNGELLICGRRGMQHKWIELTVHWKALQKQRLDVSLTARDRNR